MQIIQTKMKFQAVMISPEEAQRLLDKNHPRNRHIKEKKVRQYTRDILSGMWELNHQPIAVDEDGWTPFKKRAYAAVVRAVVLGHNLGKRTMSIPEVLKAAREHRDALEFVFTLLPKTVAAFHKAQVIAVLVRAWYKRGTKTRIEEFLNVLTNGLPQHPQEDSAAIRLRNWLLDHFTSGQQKKAKARPTPSVVYAKNANGFSLVFEEGRVRDVA